MSDEKRYVGIDKDINGGMTDTAKIIRDAWVFGIIPETETCAGWNAAGIETLWEKVNAEWGRYGFRVAALPPELRERFERIQSGAVATARAGGWDPDREIAED
ncbi:hypothetical protein GGD81_002105 [Rhodobium orientis]|uniref:Uncharacterized protein n=1 Tax=Rhodobium orientis TaxID=34017 RepID=A0A327JFP8_9HYPH|nr:hypothetical protein [Rhodobium orientis]MBB4303067.1 hypothetical protein [Rhodobium orientis]MBK5948302.1 hypothetical protein [Rhodobium orientis]RAI25139.1 hypothetical protein CH339_19565 [Rhodobium orientis]